MTIRIPKPIAISLLLVFGGGVVAMLLHQLPDLWKYIREEGM